MSDWVKALPSDVLGDLYIVIEDPHQGYRQHRIALRDELWRRFSVPVTEWALFFRDTPHGAPIISTFFCHHASSPTDPDHRPFRWLKHRHWSDYECSCGARGNDIMQRHRLPGRFWWPIVNNCYAVCPAATVADGLDHAWDGKSVVPGLDRCICNRNYTIDENYMDFHPPAKLLPVQ